MAVFELALGDWDGAYARYVHEILPVAERTRLALTDAPALLWRLEIASPEHTRLPWQALRPMATGTISRSTDSFTTLHQLLVFAGTGDASLITAWQQSHRAHASSVSGHVLDRAATALACIARGHYAAAARRLSQVTPRLPLIGGSAAQNDLFRQLEQWCRQRSPSAAAMRSLGLAA
jgi:hypothetical protein